MDLTVLQQELKTILADQLAKLYTRFEVLLLPGSDLHDELILQQSRFSQLKNEYKDNTISKDERDLSLDKLRVT
ncbi:MAG: hypothetical protein AAGD05_07690, partial [Bacteroidota bacterium]